MSYEIDFTNKVVVVTGASAGIGEAASIQFAEAGADLVLVGRDKSRLKSTGDVIRDIGQRSLEVAVDLTTDGGPGEVVARTNETFGKIDVLVHSAGIFNPIPFDDADVSVMDAHYNLNVRAPYALTHAARESLQPGGSVVFVSSVLGQLAAPGAAAYNTSKAAVEMLTKSLSTELNARDVRVNCVAPGFTATPMTAGSREDPEIGAMMRDRVDALRWGEAGEVAAGIVWIASPRAAFVYGHTLNVDGGWATH